jgi:hypothetical protein
MVCTLHQILLGWSNHLGEICMAFSMHGLGEKFVGKLKGRSPSCVLCRPVVMIYVSVLVFWVVTPCGLVGRYQRFGGTYSVLCPEDGGSMFFRNVGISLQVHTAL